MSGRECRQRENVRVYGLLVDHLKMRAKGSLEEVEEEAEVRSEMSEMLFGFGTSEWTDKILNVHNVKPILLTAHLTVRDCHFQTKPHRPKLRSYRQRREQTVPPHPHTRSSHVT